ncbi:MAG: hypothetical protein C4527_25950 [Candidatus Omnitrophota bacterium]|jgi:CheY-specific phosphatase CheX|nr:MAG: hypothetical protein C4527_25950 [Candidatus Omnitrophota bacterium]
MSNDYREHLIATATEVFEKFAFMFVDDAEKDIKESDVSMSVQSTMKFTGEKEGAIMIAVPDDLHLELAANVLGMDMGDEMVVEQADDAVKELLNVFSGHMMTTVFGEEALFNFCTPEITRLNAMQWQTLKNRPDIVEISVDDHPVLLQFTFK